METFLIIVWLLPIVFMIHDFEEIIFFQPWIKKNKPFLENKFPSISKRFLPRMEKLSVQGFSVAVFEEFLVLSLVTFISVYFNYYYLWLALFIAFSIHILIHIIQWLFILRYTPTIVTSFLSLPYCILGFIYITENRIFTFSDIVLWGILGIILMVINLIFAHSLAGIFDKKFNKRIE